MDHIRVVLVDLPPRVHGATTCCFGDDGIEYYIMFLNSRLSAEMQKETYNHELQHIYNRDFDNMFFIGIDGLEKLRHAVK